MLSLRDVHAYYADSHVLQGVTFEVNAGEVVALLGRNGAGKTTTLGAIMGTVVKRGGEIRFVDDVITGWPTHQIARHGLAYVPSGRRVFGGLTVAQNLMLAEGWSDSSTEWPLERIYGLFPRLQELAAREAARLSGGQQQMLKLSRALRMNPRLLLLDEPTEGLAPLVVAEFGEHLSLLKDAGLSILITEQNVQFAMDLADRAYVMEKGVIIGGGTIEEVRGNAPLLQHIGV